MEISEGSWVQHNMFVRQRPMVVVKIDEANGQIFCRSIINGQLTLETFFLNELSLHSKDDAYDYKYYPGQYVVLSKLKNGPLMYVALLTEVDRTPAYLCRYVENLKIAEFTLLENELEPASEMDVLAGQAFIPKDMKFA